MPLTPNALDRLCSAIADIKPAIEGAREELQMRESLLDRILASYLDAVTSTLNAVEVSLDVYTQDQARLRRRKDEDV